MSRSIENSLEAFQPLAADDETQNELVGMCDWANRIAGGVGKMYASMAREAFDE